MNGKFLNADVNILVCLQYVQKKGVILLEDLNLASVDLLSTILDFYERRKIHLMSGRTIDLHDEAYIVATVA